MWNILGIAVVTALVPVLVKHLDEFLDDWKKEENPEPEKKEEEVIKPIPPEKPNQTKD